jgi:hypothetical protein
MVWAGRDELFFSIEVLMDRVPRHAQDQFAQFASAYLYDLFVLRECGLLAVVSIQCWGELGSQDMWEFARLL